jgi:hypothetical protein
MIALFLVLHGIVFAFLEPDSWLLAGGRGLFIVLGIAAAAGLAIGAVLLVARRKSWRLFVGAGAAVSLAHRTSGERPKVAGVSPA